MQNIKPASAVLHNSKDMDFVCMSFRNCTGPDRLLQVGFPIIVKVFSIILFQFQQFFQLSNPVGLNN